MILEDGKTFEGKLLNGLNSSGEVVFNTSHSGYEEMATDPSYFNQVLVTSASMQGNYGVDEMRWESDRIQIKGFVCTEIQSSSRDRAWLDCLTSTGVPVLSDVDTRGLVRYLRDRGTVWGGIFSESSRDEMLAVIRDRKESFKGQDWTKIVSVDSVETKEGKLSEGPHIGLWDFGYKKNILRELLDRCSKVTIFPSMTSSQEIVGSGVQGVLLSNGPGDPSLVQQPVENLTKVLGKLPVMGICMGHQLLCRALGGETFKLKFGHRGSNHPIHDKISDFVFMSAQNHGYAVSDGFNEEGTEVTHYNLNDSTVAGIKNERLNCFSVQFHPESSPGPREGDYLFDQFIKMVDGEV